MVSPPTRSLPPLAALRAFEALSRHGHFRSAAQELAVTASAVSHQISALEAWLGVKLFERTTRRNELTPAGALLAPHLREAFDRIALGTELVMASKRRQELILQVYVTVAVRWLMPRLHSFQRANPELQVRFDASHLDWEFEPDSGDVGFIVTGQPNRAGLNYTPLFQAQLVAVAAPALLQGANAIKTPRDLQRHTRISLFTAEAEWETWRQSLDGEASFFTPTQRSAMLQFDSYLLALEAAAEGRGIAVVPEFLVAPELASGRLIKLFGHATKQPRLWYLVCRSARAQEPAITLFRHWLLEQIRQDALLQAL